MFIEIERQIINSKTETKLNNRKRNSKTVKNKLQNKNLDNRKRNAKQKRNKIFKI